MADNFLQTMQRGGSVMWAILLVSVTALALALERAYVLWVQLRLNVDVLLGQLIELIENDAHSQALALCSAHERHPLAAIAKAALLQPGAPAEPLQHAMQAASVRHLGQMQRHTATLASLAQVATLLGLLGTLLGLIEAFRGMGEADVASKQEILARGIAVAMLTTAFGLACAIPALLSHALISARQEHLAVQIESKASELFAYLCGRQTARAP